MSRSDGTPIVPASIYAEIDNWPFDNNVHNRRTDSVLLGDTCHVWQESAGLPLDRQRDVGETGVR